MRVQFSGKTQALGLVFALSVVLFATVVCSASSITYNVNRTIGAGSVTGFIQTDGTIGALTDANVTDWSLTLYTPVQGTFNLYGPLSGGNSVVWSTGSDISATSTQLPFNFSGRDFGVFAFQQGLFSGNHYYCDGTALAQTFGYCDQGESVVPISVFQSGWLNIPQSGNVVIGTAGSPVPEPGSLVLLGSGVLAAAGMIRRKFMA